MKKKFIILAILLITAFLLIINYNTILAFFTDKDNKTNKFSVGNISATVTEPNFKDNVIVKPNEEITKDPTFSNAGEVKSYIRAQVYVPISNKIKYIDSNGNVISPTEQIELVSYQINEGWQLVNDNDFFGTYEDEAGNMYKVYTYKFVENGSEKIVDSGETISTTLFDKVKIINYLDMDKNTNIQLHVCALSIQSDGGSAGEMWNFYKNQNGTGIVGVM